MAVGTGVEITSEDLHPAVNEAIGVWEASRVDTVSLAQLHQLDVRVAQLSGSLLGVASESTNMVWIDRDAAGHGWSVKGGFGGVDLLSTLTHEFGHILGLNHDVMGATLAPGLRDLATSRFQAADKVHEYLVDFAFRGPSLHDVDTLRDTSDVREENTRTTSHGWPNTEAARAIARVWRLNGYNRLPNSTVVLAEQETNEQNSDDWLIDEETLESLATQINSAG